LPHRRLALEYFIWYALQRDVAPGEEREDVPKMGGFFNEQEVVKVFVELSFLWFFAFHGPGIVLQDFSLTAPISSPEGTGSATHSRA
jgi:hypothetical protein